MKTSAIIKIVTWSVVGLLLIGVLVAGISGDGNFNIFDGSFSFGFSGHTYANADEYLVGNASIKSDGITEISVNWLSGTANIYAYDGDTINITEEGKFEDDYTLRYRVSGNKLTIQYCKSGFRSLFGNSPSKNLTVMIPASIAEKLVELKTDAVSADISLTGISATVCKFDTVSGDIIINDMTANTIESDAVSGSFTANNLYVNTIESDSVSGTVRVSGSVNSFNTSSVSGGANLTSDIMPIMINCDTTSGDMNITIVDGDGFTADLDSVSGDLLCGFPTITTSKKQVYGNGNAQYSFSSVSGDATINRK